MPRRQTMVETRRRATFSRGSDSTTKLGYGKFPVMKFSDAPTFASKKTKGKGNKNGTKSPTTGMKRRKKDIKATSTPVSKTKNESQAKMRVQMKKLTSDFHQKYRLTMENTSSTRSSCTGSRSQKNA
mmetsp:Transcript_156061/g.291211  ORF Transcript_156061/g.291211 Transcript_156061/m.291211 type:complete len:127 (-) Transcript_156061:63-443(-)